LGQVEVHLVEPCAPKVRDMSGLNAMSVRSACHRSALAPHPCRQGGDRRASSATPQATPRSSNTKPPTQTR
jgi:hypothetical protein